MPFKLTATQSAKVCFSEIEKNPSQRKRLKAIRKALGYLEKDPRHPSLHTHEFTPLSQEYGVKVFEAYAENHTPQAYRIFWHYGPHKGEITIIAITPHP